jgi:hypothetical protein
MGRNGGAGIFSVFPLDQEFSVNDQPERAADDPTTQSLPRRMRLWRVPSHPPWIVRLFEPRQWIEEKLAT